MDVRAMVAGTPLARVSSNAGVPPHVAATGASLARLGCNKSADSATTRIPCALSQPLIFGAGALLIRGVLCRRMSQHDRLGQRCRQAVLASRAVRVEGGQAKTLHSTEEEQEQRLFSALRELREFGFFALYRLNLFGTCSLLCQVEEQCDMRCEVEPVNAVPPWLEERDQADFRYELDGWSRFDPPAEQTEYYSLSMYAESNTGYDGRDVWELIHDKICSSESSSHSAGPHGILNAAVSAMHTSIAAHIVTDMREAEKAPEFARRISDKPEYLAALVSTRAFVLAALQSCSEALLAYDYGDEADEIMPRLQCILNTPSHVAREALAIPANTVEIRLRLRELCTAMDCVQCNACRIHGKVASMGLATAFRVLWSSDASKNLSRVEVGSLVVFLDKLTEGMRVARHFGKV